MKKTVKIMSTILLTIMLVATLASTVFAKPDVEGIITSVENDSTVQDTSKITTLGANIVNIMQIVGIVIAVVVILVIGIKYLIGSAEEKAEYKKTLLPYIFGAAMVFGASLLTGVIYNFMNG